MDDAPVGSLDSRREFLRKTALVAAGTSMAGMLGASIQKAFAIEAAPGTTYLDAEHVVILMQENRSFDHVFGTLRGVRGFGDPRAVSLPDRNPVWFQRDKAGHTYAPFHLDLKRSKATWMGDLPHGRRDQGQARNEGKHDQWLNAKVSEDKAYAGVPLTMGYYDRSDVPFYYGLADAFTVCDQAFCSVLGPTTPNRLHLWTGTVRPDKSQDSRAHVQNEDTDFGAEVSWKTFPERLEEYGITWRNYQNELAVPSGLSADADAWLSNFGDNPLEFFTQYGVYFSEPHRRYLVELEKSLSARVSSLESWPLPFSSRRKRRLAEARAKLEETRRNIERWSEENFSRLSAHDQSLHFKAFVTNRDGGDYRELATLRYPDGSSQRQMSVPKGDLLHQFRDDVRSGNLPAVSWIIPPERYSDHPSNPWYGALYVSETMDILTENPKVWEKTIFILCYDENDGYFDHVPPFIPPRSDREGTGKASAGIDTSCEHVREDPRQEVNEDGRRAGDREGPIGLGYRVPMVIASPWSRGGYVCSEVFDHTSVIRLLENFASKSSGRPIRETNISDWRRTICGDLSSAFREFRGEKIDLPASLQRDTFLAGINQAQYEPVPNDFRNLSGQDLERARASGDLTGLLPAQEPGRRPSCALPYDLSVEGAMSEDGKSFAVRFRAGREAFGARSAGSPFHVYTPERIRSSGGPFESGRSWAYAVAAGDEIEDRWSVGDFEAKAYLLRVHGPNGFFREFRGAPGDPLLRVSLGAGRTGTGAAGDAELRLSAGRPARALTVLVEDLSYGSRPRTVVLGRPDAPDGPSTLALPLAGTFGWYDLSVRIQGFPAFGQRLSGRMESGRDGFSDPLIGRTGAVLTPTGRPPG